jgi:hypothetical protein
MKSPLLITMLSGMALLAIVWFAENDTLPATDASRVQKTPVAPSNTVPEANTFTSSTSESQQAVADHQHAVTAHAVADQAKPEAPETAADHAQNNPPLSAMLEQANQELAFEEGVSQRNLMILKDLASRLKEATSIEATLINPHTREWPASMRELLSRLATAQQAEASLQDEWKERAGQDPQSFGEALLTQQQQILGPELFKQLYAEDTMIVDEAGLSAHFVSKEDAPSLQSDAHQRTLALLDQWRQEKLNEDALRTALSETLSQEEIDQLTDTGIHETAWLDQVAAFLEEYRYIEQSGIVGDDEQQLRQELIEKHFQAENRVIVNQFLFGKPLSP